MCPWRRWGGASRRRATGGSSRHRTSTQSGRARRGKSVRHRGSGDVLRVKGEGAADERRRGRDIHARRGDSEANTAHGRAREHAAAAVAPWGRGALAAHQRIVDLR
eukprot:5307345-Prymnesium_polylepis.1